ncbi:GntR family transcriptional regulator [Desulfosporosinus meridiei]|uniref:Transcriptional regulator n=1 Tax=Desulfosporosinus meridiei (strain ATCC BAA-275 / DSM 13257 / KCTC 12902 / NCIMB 13706 / S10) TaxID=768704 RepID=J7IXS3_DESMD|nr:GntR family transcriptional regulator [Desulfosporosinus meridiei]AFQ44939.1 transcriptional regulator [Desulfosporosinus meridiei DSM 13257]
MIQAEKIDKSSVIPIYYQLFKLIEEQIRKGDLKPGESLPTEHEISLRFEISRMTVRRAIAELVSAGMVYAQQGRGTFVATPKLDNIVFELNDFNQEIKERGLNCKSTLLEAKIIRADKELREKFQVGEESKRFLYFRTVFSAEDERLSYEVKYTIYSKSRPILESELKDPSLPGLIATHTEYVPMSAKKVLQVSVCTEEEAAILGIAPNSPVFLVEQTIYDPDLKPVGWSKAVYRGDRYKLTSYDGWYKKD